MKKISELLPIKSVMSTPFLVKCNYSIKRILLYNVTKAQLKLKITQKKEQMELTQCDKDLISQMKRKTMMLYIQGIELLYVFYK